MRVAVLTVGSRGDVQPLAALAAGLARSGREVVLATHEPFRPLAERAGLEFARIGPNPRDLLETEAARAWIEARNPLSFFRRMSALALPMGMALADDILRACEGADAIVASPLAVAGYHVAESRRLPFVPAVLQPLNPTRDFPSTLAPGLGWLPPRGRLLTHRLTALAFDLPFRRFTNTWRREALGLAPQRGIDLYGRWDRERVPVLYGFSSVVVPRPRDWHQELHVCGYWFLPRDPRWSPPPELTAFLDAGPPPVYIGFGSMSVRDPEVVGATVVAALRASGLRGLVGAGWAGLAVERADDVLAVGDLPHDWLFPRCAAVVHHGGAGTTATALRAGVPSLATPFFADQGFWGRRIAELGVGPVPLPMRRLEPRRLAAALRTATGSAPMRERARAIGRDLAAEDGVANAVGVMEQLLDRRVSRGV